MKDFVQKVNVAGLSANSLIEEALVRNGVGREFLNIPEIRDDIINCLKAAEIRKSKSKIITTKGDLLTNIDETIKKRLDIKSDTIRILGNNYSEQIGEEQNEASTKKIYFKKTLAGIKKLEDRVIKTYLNNMPEVASEFNNMQRITTEKVFGNSGEIVQVSSRKLTTRDDIDGTTKMNRSFDSVHVVDRKELRIIRGKSKEYATLDMYQQLDSPAVPERKVIKIREANYRLRGNELVDLMPAEEIEKTIFKRLTIDDFVEKDVEKKIVNEKEDITSEELLQDIELLDEYRKKIALKMFGTRIPNNPEIQEGIGENE